MHLLLLAVLWLPRVSVSRLLTVTLRSETPLMLPALIDGTLLRGALPFSVA